MVNLALLFTCFLDWRRISKTDSADVLSTDESEILFLVPRDSPFEIEDCIRLKRAIISSWLDDSDNLPSDDGGVLFLSPFSVLPEIWFLREGRPLLFPSDFMLEMVNGRRSLREAKGENPSAVSAKFNKLHQRLIPQFVVHNVFRPSTNLSMCWYQTLMQVQYSQWYWNSRLKYWSKVKKHSKGKKLAFC